MAKSLFRNNADSRFHRMLIYSFFTAIITTLFGGVILFLPENTSAKLVGVLTGIVFLISGVSAIYKYFHREGAKLYSLNLVFGILFTILGVVIVAYPFSVLEFVSRCLGIYIIINGALRINYAVWLKKGNEDSWLITLTTGLLQIVFGILVLFNPFVKLALIKLIGAFLLIVGILDFTDTFLFKKRADEIKNIFW